MMTLGTLSGAMQRLVVDAESGARSFLFLAETKKRAMALFWPAVTMLDLKRASRSAGTAVMTNGAVINVARFRRLEGLSPSGIVAEPHCAKLPEWNQTVRPILAERGCWVYFVEDCPSIDSGTSQKQPPNVLEQNRSKKCIESA